MRIRPDLPEIHIAVSRRIDVDSIAVDNPLYYPIRCGAVFDTNSQSAFPGDDTGDSISEKRMSFCELTVQYWAWKNVRADYYGLCHYRRYLSFSDKQYRTNEHGLVSRPMLNEKECKRFGLLDPLHMAEQIAKYDMIIPQAAPVKRMPLPHGKANTVREMWLAHEGIFFARGTVDSVLLLIRQHMPQYGPAAQAYFANPCHCGYNCYVMKKNLFDELCKLQFGIMNVMQDDADYPRARAYVGEMLFGVFCYYICKQGNYRVGERQLVLFEHTTAVQNYRERATCYLQSWVNQMVRSVVKPIFPLGSKRRECAKAIYFRAIHKNTQ